MGQYGFDPDDHVDTKDDAEIFREARLDREGLDKSQWPAQIDRAALDVQYDIAIGESDGAFDLGGAIGDVNFHWATGDFYVEGLQAMAGEGTDVADVLAEYDNDRIGKLAYRLNEFRHTLESGAGSRGRSMDIDRAIEALVEKRATRAIDASVKQDRNAGAGLRQLGNTHSVADLTLKLFSDPRIDLYAQALIENLTGSQDYDTLTELLDKPVMTTPLWDHQRRALSEWIDRDGQGYVDMATATGKTVLGLAAIAYRYGRLHPADEELAPEVRPGIGGGAGGGRPTVLIVAGNELLLKQWRDEFDEHLDIPTDRTVPADREAGATIELSWGDVEFRTAQGLLETSTFVDYDLVVLDEAHRYSRGSSDGRGWGDLFRDLREGSDAILAMSGSVDGGWTGDAGAETALEDQLDRCIKFGVPKARKQGVIADFEWSVYYAPADEEDVDRLATQTRVTRENYDATTGTLDTAALDVPEAEVPEPFTTYADVRSFVQTRTGNELREQSDPFDMFASALLARPPIRWNTSPDTDATAALVARHAPAAKTVVLVQSYDEATGLGERLVADHGLPEESVTVLESARDDRHEKKKEFNNRDGGVIVGPGDLLGVGLDMPDAEVAVNVARGGVNASLVQRIGRVLRNPEGDKEATFYHVVPQPTDDAALHDVEDGAQLLRRAAEFHQLGETFKQPPSFAAADPTIEETLVTLEDGGVRLLERLEDTSPLVDESAAREGLRRLQSAVYDANSGSGDRDRSVVTSGWNGPPGETGPGADSELFPERNEAYEHYRLALGPYRVIKRTATHRLGVDPDEDETPEGYRVDLGEEYAGTAFEEAYERWLNEYREWREACDNRDGTGEPGSLPEYKEHWPAPREDDGAMLTAEAAATIGIDYAESDPIFFPRTDEGVYSVPLPDGRRLTVEGIVDEVESEDDDPDEPRGTGYGLGLVVMEAVRDATARPDEDRDPGAFVADAVGEGLKSWLDGEPLPSPGFETGPREPVALDLADRHERAIDLVVEDEDTPPASPAEVVEAATLAALEFDPDATETYTVELRRSVATLLERVARENGHESVESLLEARARDAARREL